MTELCGWQKLLQLGFWFTFAQLAVVSVFLVWFSYNHLSTPSFIYASIMTLAMTYFHAELKIKTLNL